METARRFRWGLGTLRQPEEVGFSSQSFGLAEESSRISVDQGKCGSRRNRSSLELESSFEETKCQLQLLWISSCQQGCELGLESPWIGFLGREFEK